MWNKYLKESKESYFLYLIPKSFLNALNHSFYFFFLCLQVTFISKETCKRHMFVNK